MSNIMNLTESHLAPLPFAGDFLVPIPDEEQLWGLSPISPMTGSTWDPSKADSAAFTHSAMERDLKNAQVRNGQPTPPPYDEQQSANHLPVSALDMAMSMSMDSSASASKRRRVREYTAAAASLSPELDLDDGGPMDSAKRTKFLERNRLAASKCRQKKKEHTQQLEFRYKHQSEKHQSLMTEIARLRSEVLGLKNEVLKHSQCGDEPIKMHLAQMLKKITDVDSQPSAVAAVGAMPQSPVPLPEDSSISPLEPAAAVTTAAIAAAIAMPVSMAAQPGQAALSFGFDDPLQLEPGAAAAAEAFGQQMRRDSEASLVSEGPFAFSAEDTFDDLINV
ncbi:uncharacterized protein N7446_008435 [Penicillium canescens]|uniref:uncharacterized protein n=1 Tax=Penicillium canescens TaxID=5083 RepID=UPI0026E01DEE|nr:uncharacterized protein N7446_008435 [Penicillium canescens]KAJ6033274.1 hypothetical protein N7444_011045 [Penicillium canescens]KAJ6058852.1 hypothetical protein N7446_008435 [Penicillium canescens]